MPERHEIQHLNDARRDARLKLRSDGAEAKELLKPSAIFGRWKDRQISKISDAKKTGKVVARKSAPFVGAAAIAALLYAGRKPILNALEKLRNKDRQK